jgi:hypothetical protein
MEECSRLQCEKHKVRMWKTWNECIILVGRETCWKKSNLEDRVGTSKAVVLKLFWFAAHCKTYKNFLTHFVYKVKNILIYFKLWIKIIINLYKNGFLIFKIYFHSIHGTPNHLLRRAVWESLVLRDRLQGWVVCETGSALWSMSSFGTRAG